MAEDAGWALQQAVYAALSGDAALAAMVSGIFDHVLPDAPLPYLTIGEGRAQGWDSSSFNGQEHRFEIHAWSRAPGRKESKTILAQVYRVLHNAALGVSGQQLVNLQFEFADNFLDADGITHHGVMRFRAVTISNS